MKNLRNLILTAFCLWGVTSQAMEAGNDFGIDKARVSHFNKVVWIVFENEDFSKVLKQADFAAFAQQGVLLTNMIAGVHPSQGNYIAMTAGSTLGIKSDKNVDLNVNHVGDLLEAKGLRWRVYAEDFPGNCFTGTSSGNYVRKHVPFISYTNVTKDPKRCANIENESRFFSDLKSNNLPEFSMYIPNMKNDGHDTGVDFAGKWFTKTFGSTLKNPSALGDVLFIVTFDESSLFAKKNQIYTVLIGSQISPGSQVNTPFTHPGLLRMIEDEFQLGNLSRDDANPVSTAGIWKTRGTP